MPGIEVKQETLDRIHAMLAGVQDADKKVLKPALTRGLMAGKTQASREVRQTYHISAGNFKDKGFIRFNNVAQSGEGIIGSIQYSGSAIPLMKFKVSPSMPKQGVTPSAAVLKSSSLVAFADRKDVFVAQMKSWHLGIFSRQEGKYSSKRGSGRNKHTEQLKELYSPAIPTMVGNKKVMESVEDRVSEVINQRINHEIDRLLKQNGG